MTNYHLNPETGEPKRCSTTPEKCPYNVQFPGVQIQHFEAASKAEALSKAELLNSQNHAENQINDGSSTYQKNTRPITNDMKLYKRAEWDIAWSDKSSEEDLLKLAIENNHKQILCGVADNKNSTAKVLSALWENPCSHEVNVLSGDLRSRIAKNKNCPIELYDSFSKGGPGLQEKIAVKLDCPPEILERLMDSKSNEVKTLVLQNPNVPESVLRNGGKSGEVTIRELVAKHEKTPEDVLLKLAKQRNGDIPFNIVRNPSSTKKVLDLLDHTDADITPYLVRHPNVSAEIMQKMVQDLMPKFKNGYFFSDSFQQIAASSKANAQTLTMLFDTNWKQLQDIVVKNPNCPMKLLLKNANQLADDE